MYTMYEARGNEIWYIHPDTKKAELWLTIHPTDSPMTPEEIAPGLAEYLTNQPSATVEDMVKWGLM